MLLVNRLASHSALASVLLLTACGGSDDSGSTTSTTTTTATPTPTSTATPTPTPTSTSTTSSSTNAVGTGVSQGTGTAAVVAAANTFLGTLSSTQTTETSTAGTTSTVRFTLSKTNAIQWTNLPGNRQGLRLNTSTLTTAQLTAAET